MDAGVLEHFNLVEDDLLIVNGHTFVHLSKLGLHQDGMACLECGVMRRRSGHNAPCKGPVPVGVREEKPTPSDKPKAVIVGPIERYVEDGSTYYRPCVMYPPCNPVLGIPSGIHLSEEQSLVLLEDLARMASEAGYRVIRVNTMAERDAILTFVRECVEQTRDALVSDIERLEHKAERTKSALRGTTR